MTGLLPLHTLPCPGHRTLPPTLRVILAVWPRNATSARYEITRMCHPTSTIPGWQPGARPHTHVSVMHTAGMWGTYARLLP